jgi:DNA-directed RNA polymerase specialized sigma24 family protein
MVLRRPFLSVVSELRRGLEEGTVVLSREESDPQSDLPTQTRAPSEFPESPLSYSGEFFQFDEEYLRRLGAQDPATEMHFVSYFSERLKVTLSARGLDREGSDDVMRETFYRVWRAVQSGDVINDSRRFGSFVYSVCRNVLSEYWRNKIRDPHAGSLSAREWNLLRQYSDKDTAEGVEKSEVDQDRLRIFLYQMLSKLHAKHNSHRKRDLA